MRVILGLPSNSMIIIRGEMDSTLIRLLLAFGDKRKPTPPTEALLEFLIADDVTS